jgi:hypothetical protein
VSGCRTCRSVSGSGSTGAAVACPSRGWPSSSGVPRAGSQVERGVRSVDRFSTIIELARVLRVQVVDLTGRPLSLAPNGGAHLEAVDALRRALMSYSTIPAALDTEEEPGRRPDLARLRRTVVMANDLYQAGSYSGAGELLPGAIADAQEASRELLVMTAGRRCGSWPRRITSRPSH